MKNAQRQPIVSLTHPPRTPPRAEPTPKNIFPYPCHRPRLRSGIRSDPTKVDMAVKPPPPIPATTRPRIITDSVLARPQMRFPAAKKTLEKRSPFLRPKMSVSLPLRGCRAAFAMKYADASQDNRDKESKEVEIGADSVAIIVESRAMLEFDQQGLLLPLLCFTCKYTTKPNTTHHK